MIILTVVVVVLAGVYGLSLFFPSKGHVLTPSCETNRTMILMAQAVPSAEQLPCIRSLPLGWSVSGVTIERGRATFELLDTGEDRGGGGYIQLQIEQGGETPAVDATLTPSCPATGEDPTIQAIEVEGGCVSYRSVPAGAERVPSFDPDAGLSFVPRSQLVAFVEQDEDLILCGAGAVCP
jgi:hypothetical protein